MPYIDTTPAAYPVKLQEGNAQEKLGELLGQYWTIAGTTATKHNFFKLAFDNALNNPSSSPLADDLFEVVLARHYVYANREGKVLGLAMKATREFKYSEISANATTAARADVLTFVNSLAGSEWFYEQLVGLITNTVWHFYVAEAEPVLTARFETVDTDKKLIKMAFDADIERAALDIEVYKTAWESNTGGGFDFKIKDANMAIFQSPITNSIMRTAHMEDLYSEAYSTEHLHTNWWEDSEIRIQGLIDENNCFLTIQSDNVPAWEGGAVPTIPLYFSKIDPLDPGDDVYGFFTGTVAANDESLAAIAAFDYDDPSRVNFAKSYMPILKTYPGKPSNGIDTVMISRSKLGSRYQEYFLSWNTAPNLMPPLREQDGKQYPRAWNNSSSVAANFQFNPSRYSNKVHSSKVYLVHPEEGARGSLLHTIGLSALNFNSGKLRVRKQNCPDKLYDVFRYHLIEGVSPLTKRPGTPFRPIGMGIFDEAASDADPV